jgi:hypothetical protein
MDDAPNDAKSCALEGTGGERDSTTCIIAPKRSDMRSFRGGKGWDKARRVKTLISNLRVKPNLMPKGQPLIKSLAVTVHTAKYGLIFVSIHAQTKFKP